MDSLEQGYPENHFAIAVDEDLKCAICLSVMREPVQCEMNEHHFCAPCIKRHLHNTRKCPCCLEDLSLETLKKPSRYLTKHLDPLVIQCDHESRGCQEFVKLEDLPRHLRECGYAPIACQNDGCCEVVNKQDIFRHENEICERRRIDCHNCVETKKEIGELKESFEELFRKEVGELKVALEEGKAKKDICELRKEVGELKGSFEELLRKGVGELNVALGKKVGELKVDFEEVKAKREIGELRKEVVELKGSFEELLRKEVAELNVALGKKVGELRIALGKEVCELKVTFEEVKWKQGVNQESSVASRKEIGELKQPFGELKNQVCHITDPKINKDQYQPPLRENVIVVIGGRNDTDRLTSSEMYVWSEKKWIALPETNHPRSGSSAVVFENQVLVTGGRIDAGTWTDSIEAIQVDKKPVQWCNLAGKLPHPTSGHSCIIYQDHLIVIGGYEGGSDDISDGIYELALTPPYTCKLLSSMPSPRAYHRTELFDDKIVVIGGISVEQEEEEEEVLENSVLFDTRADKYDEIFLSGVKKMATVAWGNNVVVIGGVGRTGEILNTVKMFNTKTRKTYMLPPMDYKRYGCTAVVINNLIVVMGGSNGKFLNVVECFDFFTYTWTKLPPMNEARSFVTSVVVPVNLPLL